jgi:transketolase
MKRSKYTRPARLTEQGEGGQYSKPRLTTSAMIASLAAPGQRTRPAPFGEPFARLPRRAPRSLE